VRGFHGDVQPIHRNLQRPEDQLEVDRQECHPCYQTGRMLWALAEPQLCKAPPISPGTGVSSAETRLSVLPPMFDVGSTARPTSAATLGVGGVFVLPAVPFLTPNRSIVASAGCGRARHSRPWTPTGG
jgi:hypothetical protein